MRHIHDEISASDLFMSPRDSIRAVAATAMKAAALVLAVYIATELAIIWAAR